MLTFLIEKLNKDFNIFSATIDGNQEKNKSGSKKSNKTKQLIAVQLKALLNDFWLPAFLKMNGLKFGKDDELTHEVLDFIFTIF